MDIIAVGKKCPYCMVDIQDGEDVVLCSNCEMPHHRECWIENGGCTTFGCQGQLVDIALLNQAETLPAEGLPLQKICLVCGYVFKEKQNFCPSCGKKRL